MEERENQIKLAADNYKRQFPDGFINEYDYIAGAKWSDENPRKDLVSVDRVVDWLKENFHDYEIACTGWGHVESLNFMNMETMIEEFLNDIKK